jgi:Cys-tRNA(Pro)/Cys-tRNA(Cys) deacylase
MSTRAITFLRQKKIPFTVLKYEHAEKGAVFAAHATGLPLERTVKTLVVALGRDKHCLALMPGHRQLSLKLIAKACSEKRAVMADTSTAERLTGYLVGGISPFATRQRLPVIMEASLLVYDQVAVNAGQRGTMLVMAPRDILNALSGHAREIAEA